MSETTEAPAVEAEAPVAVSNPTDEGQSSAQAEPTAPEAGAEPDDAAEPPDKAPWATKRIGEITAQRRTAEREAAYWRGIAEAQRPTQQPQQQAGPAALPPDLAQWIGAEPKPQDFPGGEYDPAFGRAAASFDRRFDQAQQAVAQRQQQARRGEAEFGQRVSSVMDAMAKDSPELVDVLQNMRFPMPEHVVREVMDCDKPDAVLAYLARNPAEAARIAALRSGALGKAMGRIEDRLAAPKPAPVSNAPSPPRALRGSGSTGSPDTSTMSMDEYARFRNSQSD